MSEVLLRLSGFIVIGFIWAALQIATTSREAIRHEGFSELKPGLVCHASILVIWAGTIALACIFHIQVDLQNTSTDEWIFAIIFTFLILITVSTYFTKILYDEHYLCFKSPFGIKLYDWDKLKKVSEWSYNSGDILVLKFSNRFFWVAISAMYNGYDDLERLAYQKSYQYPRH